MKEFELEPGEHVIIEARKHWFIFLGELLPYAVLAVVPFLLPLVASLIPAVGMVDYGSGLSRLVLGIWLLLTWTGAWSTFTKYFLNAWILTNKRIVNIKQRAYFNREVSSLFLSRVQDVTTEVVGMLDSFLGIGTIKVQTAGEEMDFIMRGIPNPEILRDTILQNVPAGLTQRGV